MAQSLSKVLIHLVFSTKNREPYLSEEVRRELHRYLAAVCRTLGSNAYRVGGTTDHVHIACTLPRTVTLSTLVNKVKISSSAWIKTQSTACKSFAWQAGYGAFSVGESQLPALMRYIDDQKEHHRKRTFREELMALLEKYGVEYDERYLFE